jgi:ribosomal protein S18 acetylase RimI-like enzyme
MLTIRPMTDADLPLGLRLTEQAHWNQTEADWRRLLEMQPDGASVAEWDGASAGTTVTTRFGAVAWISMVLVDETMRGQGIGTALVRHALDALDKARIPTVRLDATTLGQHLYEQLGFVEQFRLMRYDGVLPPAAELAGSELAPPEEWETLAAFDQLVTRIDRRPLLSRLFAANPTEVQMDRLGAAMGGYITSRPGRQAIQIGPCIASPEAGPPLLLDAFRRHAGHRVFVDIPVGNVAATRLAESHGLTVQRSFSRMCRGVSRAERIEWLWASSGPENG